MLTRINPKTIAPPLSTYSMGTEVPPNARWLYVAGQLGIRPDGTLAQGAAAQAEQAIRNVLAVLAEARMGPENLVKVQIYLTRQEDRAAYLEARNRLIGEAVRPASTLIVVAGLARPEYLFEIDAVAAAV